MRSIASLAVLVLAACQAPAIVSPPTAENGGCLWTEHPCIDGVSSKPSGTCCPEGFSCGGSFPNVGCPADSCCDERQGPLGQRRQRRVAPAKP
jgi:hypothetical protein